MEKIGIVVLPMGKDGEKIEGTKFVQNNWFKPLGGKKKNGAPTNQICSADCIVKE